MPRVFNTKVFVLLRFVTFCYVLLRLAVVNLRSMKSFLSPKEVAAKLRVHENSVRRWVRAGKLPAVRIGGRIFVKNICDNDAR